MRKATLTALPILLVAGTSGCIPTLGQQIRWALEHRGMSPPLAKCLVHRSLRAEHAVNLTPHRHAEISGVGPPVRTRADFLAIARPLLTGPAYVAVEAATESCLRYETG